MPNYFKIGQGNQWLRPASATCDFRISHGTANSARCTSPAALPWSIPTNFPPLTYLQKQSRYGHQPWLFPWRSRTYFQISLQQTFTELYWNWKQVNFRWRHFAWNYSTSDPVSLSNIPDGIMIKNYFWCALLDWSLLMTKLDQPKLQKTQYTSLKRTWTITLSVN